MHFHLTFKAPSLGTNIPHSHQLKCCCVSCIGFLLLVFLWVCYVCVELRRDYSLPQERTRKVLASQRSFLSITPSLMYSERKTKLEQMEEKKNVAVAFKDHLKTMDHSSRVCTFRDTYLLLTPHQSALKILCAKYGNLSQEDNFSGVIDVQVQ